MEEKKIKNTERVHSITLHQPQVAPDSNGNPVGKTSSTFSAAATSQGPGYVLTPHPQGVRVKKNSGDKASLVVPFANIQGMVLLEE